MQEIITLAAANYPQGKATKGKLTATDGRVFSIDPGQLPQFQPGGQYEIAWSPYDWKGRQYFGFDQLVRVVNPPVPGAPLPPVPQPPPRQGGGGQSQPGGQSKENYWVRKEVRDIENDIRIARMATLNSAIAHGKTIAEGSGQVLTTEQLFDLADQFRAYVNTRQAVQAKPSAVLPTPPPAPVQAQSLERARYPVPPGMVFEPASPAPPAPSPTAPQPQPQGFEL